MPPIIGIYTKDRQSLDDKIIKMLRKLKYHVPRKTFVVENGGAWLAVAFLRNKRYSQEQYALYQCDNLMILADATLYRRKELLKELNINQANKPITDAILILESYRKWGEACVNHLYGDYAFVIINTTKHELFCSRDAMGIKPFFYSMIRNCFVFSSELRYLVELFDQELEDNDTYLLETLVTVKSAKHRTPFNKIFRLPPGSYLKHEKQRTIVASYWQPDLIKQINLKHEIDYVELLREKLVQAVSMRCADASRIGFELSGGLDSSTVVGIANDNNSINKKSFIAFSNVFPKDSGIEFKDESEFAAIMTGFNGLNWIAIDRLNRTIVELFKQALEIQGCYLQQNFSIFNNGIYEAVADQGIDTLLSGFGGDEMVSARTAIPWNELIQTRQWKVLFDEMFYKDRSPRMILKLFRILARFLANRMYHPAHETGVFTKELLDKRFARLALQPDFSREKNLRQMLADKYIIHAHRSLAERQVERLMADHLPQRLEYCYAAAAQYGIEYRYPLLDKDLIETYLAFPPWLKHHHGVNRYIFREAIKGFVPEEIRNRNDKSGTTIPHVYNSLVNERETILALIEEASSSTELNRIFDFERFPAWYESLVARDEKDMNSLMPGAFFQYLMMLLYYK